MFNGIRWRLVSYYLLVIAVIVIVMGLFFIWFLNYFYRQSLEESLYVQARLSSSLVEEMINHDSSPAEIDAISKRLGRELGVRLTLVNSEGVVVADSAEDPALMENHRDRPEIIEAMEKEKGISVRYSNTLEEKMYYLAVPLEIRSFDQANEMSRAVLRLALPLVGINRAIYNLLLFIISALVVSSLAALIISVVLSRKITDPIRMISDAAGQIAGGNYSPVIEIAGKDELADLADNIREMGYVLSNKMDQVLWEKSKLETVVSSMSSGIILTDHEHNIDLINPAAEKLFDVGSSLVTGMPVQKAIRYYALNENLKAVYHGNESRMIEMSLYYPRQVILEVHFMPVRGSEEIINGVLMLFHEVTQLRSIEKMRTDFVANVSHELRTPLTVVRGYTETIMHEELTREQLIDFLQVIDRETNRLSSLLDDLLDLAQIENEKGLIKTDIVNLSDLILEANQRVEDLRKQNNTQITLSIGQNNCLVRANYEWLCQALVNILENSIRHGYREGKIELKLSSTEDRAIVEISDNGPGIPEADLPYIFERFYRVDKARSRKSGGTGLGLSIVKHIMEAHEADYSLESREGSGTIFHFSLPLNI